MVTSVDIALCTRRDRKCWFADVHCSECERIKILRFPRKRSKSGLVSPTRRKMRHPRLPAFLGSCLGGDNGPREQILLNLLLPQMELKTSFQALELGPVSKL